MNHHPSMPEFLTVLLEDIDKQLDRAKSAQLFEKNQGRKKRDVAKERVIKEILDDAEWDTAEEIEVLNFYMILLDLIIRMRWAFLEYMFVITLEINYSFALKMKAKRKMNLRRNEFCI